MRQRASDPRGGVAAVELAAMLPFLVLMMAGIWEVSRMVQVENLMANAAREGARQAASGQANNATCCQTAVNYLNLNGLTGVTTSMVSLTNTTSSARSNPMTATQLDQFTMTITVPYTTIRWSTIAQITPTSNLVATASWNSTLSLPGTGSTTLPAN
jgi:Flp pilus assembly protein TadG